MSPEQTPQEAPERRSAGSAVREAQIGTPLGKEIKNTRWHQNLKARARRTTPHSSPSAGGWKNNRPSVTGRIIPPKKGTKGGCVPRSGEDALQDVV